MQEPIKALDAILLRAPRPTTTSPTCKTMELKANSSNNTIFADADGDIAYFHGNYIPRRDTSFDWTRPVDGSNPATEWHGLLYVDETPHLLNPKSGWLYNSNNWPWSAAGPSSPKKEDYPGVCREGRRIRTRPARHPRPPEQEGLHAGLPDRRRLRQLSHLVRKTACPHSSTPGTMPPAPIR